MSVLKERSQKYVLMYSVKSHHSFNKLNVSLQPSDRVSLWCPHLRKCISIHSAPQDRNLGIIPSSSLSLTSLSPSQRQNLPPEYFFKYPSSLPPSTLEVFPLDRDCQQVSLFPNLPSFPSPFHLPHPLLIYLQKNRNLIVPFPFLPFPVASVG